MRHGHIGLWKDNVYVDWSAIIVDNWDGLKLNI